MIAESQSARQGNNSGNITSKFIWRSRGNIEQKSFLKKDSFFYFFTFLKSSRIIKVHNQSNKRDH
jgi:hypothetical protein